MSVRVLLGGPRKLKAAGVSLNSKYNAININKAGLQTLLTHLHNDKAEFAQIIVDDERPNTFWIRVCRHSDEGAHRSYPVSKCARLLHSKLLFKELNLQGAGVVKGSLVWDQELLAGRVNLNGN